MLKLKKLEGNNNRGNCQKAYKNLPNLITVRH
jgi:hypothetical protein